ncbi:AAA family ATPase, partial [Klebsiella pneumoniae]
MARAEQRGLVLSGEQSDALAHLTDGRDLGVVVGHAGTGKSAMLGVARETWEATGYEVRGAALSGIAAESLEAGSGIASRTIAS